MEAQVNRLTFATGCSGIGAPEVAWGDRLGWRSLWCSEIEDFPSAVLEYRWPNTPNVGDFAKIADKIESGELEAPDVFIAGCPCQAFSVAGLRKSLDDNRGGLTLEFIRIANSVDDVRRARGEQAGIFLFENVPGILSTKDNAFGCLLAGLSGASDELRPPKGNKWPSAGVVFGKREVAWRVLDAQYFGVAQRRRRVFVIASARAEFSPAHALFECGSVPRHTPPSRETRQEATTDTGEGFNKSSYAIGNGQVDEACAMQKEVMQTLNCMHDQQAILCLNDQGGSLINVEKEGIVGTLRSETHGNIPIVCSPIASTLVAGYYKGGLDNQHIYAGCPLFIVQGSQDPICNSEKANAVNTNNGLENVICWASGGFGQKVEADVASTLSTDHDDRVTGNNAALIQTYSMGAYPCPKDSDTAQLTTKNCSCVRGDSPLVQCFTEGISRGFGSVGSNISNSLRVGGGEPCVAIAENIIGRKDKNGGNGTGATEELAYTQNTAGVMGVAYKSTVRRLTTVECARLQAFPDHHTDIPWRGKPNAPQGRQYKGYGNSMCVNVIEWLGKIIEKEILR